MSIKRKLTLTIMGISLAAVGLTVGVITTYLIYDMRFEKAQELSLTAGVTADRNSAALAFGDSASAQNNLEVFQNNPAMMIACLYDAQGNLFAHFARDGEKACPERLAAIEKDTPGAFSALKPVGESYGHVYLLSDTSAIAMYVKKIVQISATSGMLVLLITLMMTFYFRRTISAPIMELTARAEAITSSRDFSLQANVTAADETGQLARAFNRMLEEVRLRDRELVEANETLEEKVRLRTKELESAKHRADMANEAKSEFLRNMSHEFRTPLHAIVSFSAYGVKEHSSADRSELMRYFEIIGRGAERLGRLVNEVLNLARLEHGESSYALQPADLGKLTARVAELMAPLLLEKNLTLSFEHKDTLGIIYCDHDKIMQVLTNLLGNAIKFTTAGGHITLRTEMLEDGEMREVRVSVIDDGVGIPEEECDSIFESFRQSSRTNTGAGGTGLGLAICRGIVRAHGGRIWAENNREGKGACVSFTLPMLPEIPNAKSITQTGALHEHVA